MHYYEHPQEREKILTRDFIRTHWSLFCRVVGLDHRDKIVIEMQKAKYGKSGDVDIAVWRNPDSESEELIAIEVKTIFLNGNGDFKSEKIHKHKKQLKALEMEGWDYVFFFDFIVTEPANGWFHSQAFEGRDKYVKEAGNENYGHVMFQINSVKDRPESVAGSISHKILQEAKLLSLKDGRPRILEAFRKFDFLSDPVIVDSVFKREPTHDEKL